MRRAQAEVSLRARLDYCRTILSTLLWSLDPGTVRIITAGSCLLWAIGAMPWLGFQPFERNGYQILASAAPGWVWAVVFLLHPVATAWDFIVRKDRDWLIISLNAYAFALWTGTSLAINFSVRTYTPTTGPEWIIAAVNGWLFIVANKPKQLSGTE
ncbi:MAG: hypothetical protein EOP02_28250 [Proteobacteria bacterium]|nr:MAG: hypothetical protein EOP02_28250 [Pseudomonadota bacterium]